MDGPSPDCPKTPHRTARPTLTDAQQQQILEAASRRVTAAVYGRPRESVRACLGEIAETLVYGAFVTLKRDGRLRSCCGHITETVRLADALDVAADRAATDDPRFPPIMPSELQQLEMDVWVLWGPENVEERGEGRIKAVTIGRHGVQIARGHNRGLLLPGVAMEHGFDAKTFLEQVCLKAGLPRNAWKEDDVRLRVFEGNSIHGCLKVACDEARPPAVAGGFYPGEPAELQQALDTIFATAEPAIPPEEWAAVMAPHAGWIYSGRLAAAVYRRVKFPSQIVVLCPKHRPHGARWAVAPHQRWLFPGGQMASDPDLAHQLCATITGLEMDAVAHQQEHAIEVQLPLLARVAPESKVVGIVVGDASLPELLCFGTAMAMVLRELPERPLIVISSDMNHFANDEATRRLDRLALQAIASLNPERVYETVRANRISMCGMAPCVATMEALRWMGGLNRCEQVGYATSADAGGSTDRVVGYAGLLFR